MHKRCGQKVNGVLMRLDSRGTFESSCGNHYFTIGACRLVNPNKPQIYWFVITARFTGHGVRNFPLVVTFGELNTY